MIGAEPSVGGEPGVLLQFSGPHRLQQLCDLAETQPPVRVLADLDPTVAEFDLLEADPELVRRDTPRLLHQRLGRLGGRGTRHHRQTGGERPPTELELVGATADDPDGVVSYLQAVGDHLGEDRVDALADRAGAAGDRDVTRAVHRDTRALERADPALLHEEPPAEANQLAPRAALLDLGTDAVEVVCVLTLSRSNA